MAFFEHPLAKSAPKSLASYKSAGRHERHSLAAIKKLQTPIQILTSEKANKIKSATDQAPSRIESRYEDSWRRNLYINSQSTNHQKAFFGVLRVAKTQITQSI